MSTAPETSDSTRRSGRTLDVVTAIMLGIVSLTTALGAWQATSWSRDAADFAESSSDARDQNIARSIDWQSALRLDSDAIEQARKFALQEDAATAAGDARAAAYTSVMVGNYLGRSVNPELPSAFATWRAAGFPTDQLPTSDPEYLAELRGDADSYSIVAAMTQTMKDNLVAKSSAFTQAALVDALALFLLGVAGINRLRSARFATLVLGAAAYLASLFMMLGAY